MRVDNQMFQYIGKLDINKLGKYKDKIINNIVIMTNERIQHIKNRHSEDYEKYTEYISNVIYNPDYILDDKENIDTILILKNIIENNRNIQIVIRLHTNKKEENKYNSILTFWHIRDRNYKSTLKKHTIIYNKFDNNE